MRQCIQLEKEVGLSPTALMLSRFDSLPLSIYFFYLKNIFFFFFKYSKRYFVNKIEFDCLI